MTGQQASNLAQELREKNFSAWRFGRQVVIIPASQRHISIIQNDIKCLLGFDYSVERYQNCKVLVS